MLVTRRYRGAGIPVHVNRNMEFVSLLRRCLRNESGQDLVEYALLSATVALAAVVAMSRFSTVMNTVYTSWLAATDALWYPEPPAS